MNLHVVTVNIGFCIFFTTCCDIQLDTDSTQCCLSVVLFQLFPTQWHRTGHIPSITAHLLKSSLIPSLRLALETSSWKWTGNETGKGIGDLDEIWQTSFLILLWGSILLLATPYSVNEVYVYTNTELTVGQAAV